MNRKRKDTRALFPLTIGVVPGPTATVKTLLLKGSTIINVLVAFA